MLFRIDELAHRQIPDLQLLDRLMIREREREREKERANSSAPKTDDLKSDPRKFHKQNPQGSGRKD